jgi:hypothetical protein
MSGTSRYLEIRPSNIPSDGKISYKNGFPMLSFTIASQNGLLDPSTIRIVGNLNVYKDNASPTPTPVVAADDPKITMDNRLGVFALWEQLTIRHGKSKMVCEQIRHYNRYMSTYLGVTSSNQDLMGHLGETALCMPNPRAFVDSVIVNNASGTQQKSFSCHLPSGFLSGGNHINLMQSSFGSLELEIMLAPDSNVLFSESGVITGLEEAHYQLSDLKLTCEVGDIAPSDMAMMSAQTTGSLEYNTITGLYTSINTSNAQVQYDVALRQLQSAFMTFCPSDHINSLAENGLATTFPAKADKSLAHFTRVQFLRGGQKYPADFDYVTNIAEDGNVSVVDPQLARLQLESIIPEYHLDRTSASAVNLNRNYSLGTDGSTADSYKAQPDGGSLVAVGVRYSQFNSGQDFSREQWGVSLESTLEGDKPQSLFLFLKARATLMFSPTGVQILQ